MGFASDILRGIYKQGAKSFGRGAGNLYSRSARAGTGIRHWGAGLGGDAMSTFGKGARGMSRMGPVGMWGATGAGAGAMYGAVDPNTSIIGGALAGAGIGMAGAFGVKLGRMGKNAYRNGMFPSVQNIAAQTKNLFGPSLRSNAPMNSVRK